MVSRDPSRRKRKRSSDRFRTRESASSPRTRVLRSPTRIYACSSRANDRFDERSPSPYLRSERDVFQLRRAGPRPGFRRRDRQDSRDGDQRRGFRKLPLPSARRSSFLRTSSSSREEARRGSRAHADAFLRREARRKRIASARVGDGLVNEKPTFPSFSTFRSGSATRECAFHSFAEFPFALVRDRSFVFLRPSASSSLASCAPVSSIRGASSKVRQENVGTIRETTRRAIDPLEKELERELSLRLFFLLLDERTFFDCFVLRFASEGGAPRAPERMRASRDPVRTGTKARNGAPRER